MKKLRTIIVLIVLLNFSATVLLGQENQEDKEHSGLMRSLDIKKHDIKRVGIFVYNGVNDLDAIGPRYVMKNMMGVEVLTIAPDTDMVTTVMGLSFKPDVSMKDVDQLDILIIPGGFKETIEQSYNQELLDWIKKIDQKTTYTASVCTGGWILGKTGLLEGRKATGNWFKAEEMLKANGAEFTGERYTRDGKYWTSAGVTAGIDMSLAMLVELTGKDYAQAVMLDMEYDPKAPIEGGNVENTDPAVLKWMFDMYDMMSKPVFDEMKKKN